MKNFSFFILLFSFLFVACNKSDLALLQENEDVTTFTLAIEQEATPAVAKAATTGKTATSATRATTTITPARYIMEVWSEDGLTAENVFEGGKNHAEITSGGVFTVTLDKTKAYTCLFWADDNAAFDATQLKSVALNTGKEATEAYFAKVNVPKGRNLDVAVTLKRAVAKIVLAETEAVQTADNLALSFSDIYPQFNVLTGEASGTAAPWTKTINPTATIGQIATLYFFAKAGQQLSELKFTYATETEKTVSNIPYQQNFATRIKGAYSSLASFTFTVTADDVWNNPDNEVEFSDKLKVGSFYYNDNTFSNTFDATNSCIGIVYEVNADGKTGKIVGLTEGSIAWSTEQVTTGATNTTDGRANMATIAAFITDQSKSWDAYPAFKWVAEQNGKDAGGWADTDKWYLPAKDELKALYTAWNGGATTPANNAARTAFNTQLTTAGGTALNAPGTTYWSSSENNSSDDSWYVNFHNGYTYNSNKTSSYRVRCVREF